MSFVSFVIQVSGSEPGAKNLGQAKELTRAKLKQKGITLWNNWGAWGLALIFVVVMFWLTTRQYAAFHTRAPDLAMFDQAIWNTLRGRFLFSTIMNRSILANHFSPYMALLAPLFLIWPDVRMLYLAQIMGLAAAGLFLYKIVQSKHPAIAFWFLLAYYLNPTLHEIALFELRRVTLAVPFLALALYALHVKKRWLMVVGLLFALLCKENIGLIVFMVGFYLLVFERECKWGVPLMGVGGVWVLAMMLWVIPAFAPRGSTASVYLQLDYFSLWGDSFSSILGNMLSSPLAIVQRAFDQKALQALWRVFLPMGLVLPLLAPSWLLIGLPSIFYMLVSSFPNMHRLADWYMASVLPVLFAAVGVGLTRLSDRWARRLTAALLVATLLGYRLFSFAPLGGRFDRSYYQVTEHHRLAAEVVAAVPADARVAAQDPYIFHLAHREHIYLYPWIAIGKENVDYFVFDRQMPAYPFAVMEMNYEIDNMVANPDYVVEIEADGIYLLHNHGAPLFSFPIDRVAEDTIRLDRVEVAIADERGLFNPAGQEPVALKPGQEVRVTLYWEALNSTNAERTVSVRVADASGALAAQQDMLPSKGARPTSWWETGWEFRDVYYLTISPQAQPGPGSLDLLLYDTYSLEHIPFDGGTEILTLCNIALIP